MKYSNQHNLPPYMVQYLLTDDYDYIPGTISATQLLQSQRMYALGCLHKDELEMDVSDLMQMRSGTAFHMSIEAVKIKDAIQEVRYQAKIAGMTLTGKPDLILDKHLPLKKIIDAKETTKWKYIHKDYGDYIKQVSVYRWILKQNDIYVSGIGGIWFKFRDWSRREAAQNEDYPQLPMLEEPIELMRLEDTKDWIEKRILALLSACELEESELPECTRQELWMDEPKFAVMKGKNKKATRVFESEIEALEYIKAKDNPDFRVERRESIANRCGYCVVRQFCSQFKRLKVHQLVAPHLLGTATVRFGGDNNGNKEI